MLCACSQQSDFNKLVHDQTKKLSVAEQERKMDTVSSTVASDLIMPTANLFGSCALSLTDNIVNALNFGSETRPYSDIPSLTDKVSNNSSSGNFKRKVYDLLLNSFQLF